ncbi:MAG: putative toxin-antitoxin system toxin component, PIN family [Ignavibacteriales bacterium]|nr:MAG: putative toxin-antitoxin system toxin component, PIN family [Ignavibacteriales bacterium]
MEKHKIVIDTNVIVSALKSKNGYSYKLLSIIDDERFRVFISTPVVLEYEEALKREKMKIALNKSEIDDVLNYICMIAEQRQIYYLWRPFLKDQKDDMFLELAVEAGCDFIITFNKKDFKGIEKFGLKILSPKELLKLIGEKYE